MATHFKAISFPLLISLTAFCILLPVFAPAEEQSHVFRNQDLKKYDYSSSESKENASDDTEEVPGKTPIKTRSEEPKLVRFAIPYIAYEGMARRIIIPVTFNDRVTAPMLLDTGAPGMHISNKLAEKLNLLNKEDGNLLITIGGIGGMVPAVFTIVDSISVGKANDNFIPTTIAPSMSDHFEGLIGMDFMANYAIQIDNRQQILIFTELPERADLPAGHDESWWKITFHRFKSMKSAWGEFRKILEKKKDGTEKIKKMIKFADKQYGEAEYLYNRLSVYASENSVPREWR